MTTQLIDNCNYPVNCNETPQYIKKISSLSCFSTTNNPKYIYGVSKITNIKIDSLNKNIILFGDIHGEINMHTYDKKNVITIITILNYFYNKGIKYNLFLETPQNINIDKCNFMYNLIYYSYSHMKNKLKINNIDIRYSMNKYIKYHKLFVFIEWYNKTQDKTKYISLINKWYSKLQTLNFIEYFKRIFYTEPFMKLINVSPLNKLLINYGYYYLLKFIPNTDNAEILFYKLFICISILVDIYTCLSILSSDNNNIIIYIGTTHINNIINILKGVNLDLTINYNYESSDISENNIIPITNNSYDSILKTFT